MLQNLEQVLFVCQVLKTSARHRWFHKINLYLKSIKMFSLCLQECTWFYAHEDSAVSRNWKIHFRSVQQTIWQYSRDDSPLHSEQTANPWRGTHVSLTSRHWTVALATACLLHHSNTVSAQRCKNLWLWTCITAVRDYNVSYGSTVHGTTVSLLPQNFMLPTF